MLRSIGKMCFAYAYKLTHPNGIFLQPKDKMPFIVCYHRVVENFERSAAVTIPSMLISARMLERQIDWLARRFSLLSLDEIGKHLESRQPFSRPTAAITFDDGYSDDYNHAYPILRRKGVPAAFFVVTGLIDSRQPQIFDRLYLLLRLLQQRDVSLQSTIVRALNAAGADTSKFEQSIVRLADPLSIMTSVLKGFPQQQIEGAIAALEQQVGSIGAALKEMAPLTWEMIKTMHRGGMTIGSHTHSHVLLTAERMETVKRELVGSKRILEAQLKTTVSHFAYPDGRFSPSVIDAVHDSGYRFAYGTCNSPQQKSPLLTIPRKVLWERACLGPFGKFSSAVMNCQVNWVFDVSRRCGHDHSQSHEEITNVAIS